MPHSDWSFYPGNYAQDIRKLDRKNKKWYFEVKNEFKQASITLKWSGLEQVEYYALSLTDLDAHQKIDLYNIAEYTFNLEKGGIRHFKLTAKIKHLDKGRF